MNEFIYPYIKVDIPIIQDKYLASAFGLVTNLSVPARFVRPPRKRLASARGTSPTRGPLWGYIKSQFSRDLVKFWR